MDVATAEYLQCLSFGPAKELTARTVQSVCAEQRNESVERNCLLFAALIEKRITGAKECVTLDKLEEIFGMLGYS